MRVRLYRQNGSRQFQRVVLDRFPAVLGSSDDAEHIGDALDGHHCEMAIEDDTLRVRDLESMGGTFVNDQKVCEAPLLPGDRLRLGEVEFVISYERLTVQRPRDILYHG
ncbi:FHA domain-containing protein [Thalassoroseus pseudoceratinae]|uniref:FHA domain-containing protein n=1 Tax=Thalassoroseus pseudoceratinae TaxID=2713176 RepID=UPI0014203303|nr:FHA domain-containing protein [Thalassoroseus pseudoceratinae]